MKTIERIYDLQAFVQGCKNQARTVALVPTMGALHDGHLSLISEARQYADVVICSIFVNPTQFNNASDLEKYPRTVEADLSVLGTVDCDVVFLPNVEEMYPNGLESKSYQLGNLDQVMEGAFRPGHFNGVATVVSRFFEVVQPDVAVFGEKDFQQVAVIKRMVELDQHQVKIVEAPIKRESNGLAMSSRNVRLSHNARENAACIYEAMVWAQRHYAEFTPQELVNEITNRINANEGFEVEYVEFCDTLQLYPVVKWSEYQHVQLCLAVFCEEVRLIDNLSLF